ncbi:TPA: hypothetical protein N0F65_007686 [Lagenidium giganteum]|uniref:Complex 1 LYR protein domain-containing protein n=1 Tax=Lagenidium giganteum TaxID=4803 RepID=A0AAV2Z4I0_9STRA|nr:TPA: hypothetical protein N0F65_007686 [Lagenidium giganteum]
MRHSGLQLQVLALYKTALKTARQKDIANGTSRSTFDYVRERFRDEAFSVPRNNFAIIEHLLRKGQRDIKMLERMKSANFTRVPRSSGSA